MEPKQIVMLTVLLLAALVGCSLLVWTMMNLDKEEGQDGGDNSGH